jgi:hypothetical protein
MSFFQLARQAMNNYYTYITILLVSWLAPVIMGYVRFSRLDGAARLFWLLAVLAFTTDCVAVYSAVVYKGNTQVYNAGSILYIFMICLYFDRQIIFFRKRHLGIIIGLFSIIVGALGSTLLQPFTDTNTYFRIYQVLIIECLSLTSMGMIIFQPAYINVRKQPHFWLAAILVFFWTFMYLHLLLYDYFTLFHVSLKWLIDRSILIANVVNNTAVATVFYLYPKMTHTDEPPR